MQIYFIETEDGRYVKIGKSHNAVKRLRSLQTANPGVRLLGVLPEREGLQEGDLHLKFAADHHEGEWFVNSPQIREFVKTLEYVVVPPQNKAYQLRKPRPLPDRLPGFEKLGASICVFQKCVTLRHAKYYQVRELLKNLIREQKKPAATDTRLGQARALVAKMKAHPGRNRGVMVETVLGLD